MGSALRLNVRCFLEGVEIPVIAVTTQESPNQAVTAQVHVIPTEKLFSLLPKTTIFVFYYDSNITPAEFVYSGESRVPPIPLRELSQAGTHAPNYGATLLPRERWRLLFAGVVYGMEFSKTHSSRSVILHCVDSTVLFDQCLHYFVESTSDTGFAQQAILLSEVQAGGGAKYTLHEGNTVSNPVTNFISQLMTSDKALERIIDDLIFGFTNVNKAFRSDRQRFDLLRHFFTLENLTAKSVFSTAVVDAIIENRLAQQSSRATTRDLLRIFLSMIYHTYTPCPRMAFTHGASSPYGYFVTPDTTFLMPPGCNVLYPSFYDTLSYSRNALSEPTRYMLVIDGFVDRITRTTETLGYSPRYFAPPIPVDSQELQEFTPGNVGNMFATTMFPYERFSGPILRTEMIPDLAIGVNVRGQKFDTSDTYGPDAATYNFWKARVAPRQLTVEGPFNPEPVVGFPILVLDRPGVLREDGTPTSHFMGRLVSIVHFLTQSGGRTSYQIATPYTTNEAVELAGRIWSVNDEGFPKIPKFYAEAWRSGISSSYNKLLGLDVPSGSTPQKFVESALLYSPESSDGIRLDYNPLARPIVNMVQVFGAAAFPGEAELQTKRGYPAKGVFHLALLKDVDQPGIPDEDKGVDSAELDLKFIVSVNNERRTVVKEYVEELGSISEPQGFRG